MRALIIDDSKPVRSILGSMLRGLGIDSVEAANGQLALQQLQESGAFDIAWVDWNMPVMDGMEFVRRVRADSQYDRLRLVMVTTESDLTHIQQAMQAGANDYIVKPFTQEILEDKLALLGLHPLRARATAPRPPEAMSPQTPDACQPAGVPLDSSDIALSSDHESASVNKSGGSDRIRVLIVDDSVVVRGVMKKLISADPDLEVAGVASDGRAGLGQIERVRPDVVLLDIEMPNMNGFETLKALRPKYPRLPVIMFSSLTERGATATIEALMLGAHDYVHKPGGSRMDDSRGGIQRIQQELIPKIKALAARRNLPKMQSASARSKPVEDQRADPAARSDVQVVVIGVSTGGPQALAILLPGFAQNCPVPILVVQHMPPVFTKRLADRLASVCQVPVKEAGEGDVLQAGQVFIAPGGYHMQIARERDGVRCRMNQDPPENACRPAVDVLFRSAAQVYGSGVLALILTGMGRDGLNGCQAIHKQGGRILAQDEETSIVWGMPGHVARAGLTDEIVSIDHLPREILRRLRRRRS